MTRADSSTPQPPYEDPRHAHARSLVEKAEQELAAEQPVPERLDGQGGAATHRWKEAVSFLLEPSALVRWIVLSLLGFLLLYCLIIIANSGENASMMRTLTMYAAIAMLMAFGVLFALFVTLIMVPALYSVGDDCRHGLERLKSKLMPKKRSAETDSAETA